MTSLHDAINERLPNAGPLVNADPVVAVLARLRTLLDVESATLTRVFSDSLRLVASSGNNAFHAAMGIWQARAAQADEPLIISDAAPLESMPGALRFYAGILLATGDDSVTLLLSLADGRPRSPAMAHRLAALAIDVTSRVTIARLAKTVEQQSGLLNQRRARFNRASQTARIGVWSCDLTDQSLEWTDSIYDLFELPRGSALHRQVTLDHYTAESRVVMEAARTKAIAECSDFSVDVEIITTSGKRRWMRLTGSVEAKDGVPVRIFGMKQDITEEKLLADRTRYLAETDVMTGLANRSQFQNHLADLSGARYGVPIAGLLLVDLDGFKAINDSHGHALGDECLKEAAARLAACCADAALVARIGGDEFAVLVDQHCDMEALARTIVRAIGQPLMLDGQTMALSASVGVARYRGGSADELFGQADIALYAAKAAGRRTSRTYAA